MALRVWLHRTAPDDVPAHWALVLGERCRRYNTLPAAGGAYEQDEWLMALMEQAAGVSALFDADAKYLIGNDRRLNLHTRLGGEAADFIKLVNDREERDVINGNAEPGTEPASAG